MHSGESQVRRRGLRGRYLLLIHNNLATEAFWCPVPVLTLAKELWGERINAVMNEFVAISILVAPLCSDGTYTPRRTRRVATQPPPLMNPSVSIAGPSTNKLI
jgi:hypothetical protein